jgi:hypothetical protein
MLDYVYRFYYNYIELYIGRVSGDGRKKRNAKCDYTYS